MEPFAIWGNFIYTEGPEKLCLRPNSFAVCNENGLCEGVFDRVPDEFGGIRVDDCRDFITIPGYCDMHLHAGQYRNLGRGMDLQLIQWLEELTYPEESMFRDLDFAKKIYKELTGELVGGFTTRAAIFSTAHTKATLLLMDELESSGLKTFVGRVNMDSNAPDSIRERDAAYSLAETQDWLEQVENKGYRRTQPILTPRFVPSCSPALLKGLGEMAGETGLPVQSHLDENRDEIEWVRQLHPNSPSYAAVYDENGLLGSKTLMAHCIYMTDEECTLMKERGAYVVHCPTSNTNVRSGIAPMRKYLDMGLHTCLGSDISGGHTLDMAEVIRQAIAVSRALWQLDEGHPAYLTAQEAFYMATEGGGSFFGKVGSFQPGYEFDAVVVDDSVCCQRRDTLETRFEKLIYLGESYMVRNKYVAGESAADWALWDWQDI
ncbi:MAG: amidohydrolase family protein [Oscillospiraceae bacterium]|nr:amidohydrolase family protein [Oscillospiraceae bacterium]